MRGGTLSIDFNRDFIYKQNASFANSRIMTHYVAFDSYPFKLDKLLMKLLKGSRFQFHAGPGRARCIAHALPVLPFAADPASR